MKNYYINGNYLVSWDESFTIEKRPLRRGETFIPKFPDSLDIKLTEKCGIGCPFCHESSTPQGKSFIPDHLKKVLSELPRVGIELAFGGGDLAEIPEETKDMIQWSIGNGFRPRVTLNCKDLHSKDKTKKSFIQSCLDNIPIPTGISINNLKDINLIHLDDDFWYGTESVFHVIIGVLPEEDLEKMLFSKDPHFHKRRILILGFKQFGRAKNMKLDTQKLEEWKDLVRKYIMKTRITGWNSERILAFDNLALEQLGLKDFLLPEEWNSLYMGRDFSHSMYIDAVKETFAPTSRSENRIEWNKTKGILDFFNKNKNSYD